MWLTDIVSPKGGRKRRRIRAFAQHALYPLDRLSYVVYALLRSKRVSAKPLQLDTSARSILILAPHQDDELLGCGGLMARYATRCAVQVAFVTNGEGRSHRSAQARQALAEMRKSEARNVAQSLSIAEPIFLDLEDGRVREQERLVPILEELLERIKPDLVLAPFLTDGHRDHVATTLGLANVSAATLDPLNIALYQVHSHIPDRLLNCYLGLSQTEHQAKSAALRLYLSQDMNRKLTLTKYLMFSRIAPQIKKPRGTASIEHFAVMKGRQLRELALELDIDAIVPGIKTISYSPYSFRNFLHNRKLLDMAPDGRSL